MSYIPVWLTDTGSISSIIGLVVTIFLLYEARKIRQSFLAKARLPEAIKELKNITSSLSKTIPKWKNSKVDALSDLGRCKSILINIKPKLSTEIKNDVNRLILKLKGRRKLKSFWTVTKVSDMDEDMVWDLYIAINSIVEGLKQTQHDLRWE